MPQKRKAKPLRRGSRKLKAARHEPGNFDLWLDGTLRLKESRSFHAFEAQLLEKYNCLDATVDDRATCAYELGLLYCQLGSFAQADKYLSELGFKYRLGKQIWLCQPTAKGSEGSLSEPFACFDNILPECFLSRLLVAFSSDSAFWAEHGYPTDRFFSYNTQLPGTASLCEETVKRKASARAPSDAAASGDNLMAQLAQYLMPLVAASFPAKAVEGIRSVEWWAHSRPNGPAAGHRVSCTVLF